jgi:hypothetical protein
MVTFKLVNTLLMLKLSIKFHNEYNDVSFVVL